MSRTTLSVITATALIAVSAALMAGRYYVLGDEVKIPNRPGTWKVTLLVRGNSSGKDSKLMTLAPLDFGHQHIEGENFRSAELAGKPIESRNPGRRQAIWAPRSGFSSGPIQARFEFHCVMDIRQPTSAMARLSKTLYGPPRPGTLDAETQEITDSEKIAQLASRLTQGIEGAADQAEVLYRFVDQQIQNEPSIGVPVVSSTQCLKNEAGDSGGKSRLLVALLRHRGIPARLVTGLTLTKGPEQLAHYWVEAWVQARWMAMCPFHHHYGKVPATYLVFGFGDQAMVRGRNLRDLDYAFLVERKAKDPAGTGSENTWLRRGFLAISFHGLPPGEQRLVEFLLLLPMAALMVCLFRNVIGLNSFGTFAPALVGLAFRDWHSLPGILVFVGIILVGWVMRRVLDHYHLLQLPRTAFLLTLVIILLIAAIVIANSFATELIPTQVVALFPIVILTGMIERFWTLETEDCTASSFRTLLGTVLIAVTIALVLSLRAMSHHLFRFPETLGIIMAAQLLLGRYTGYRLLELFRFRDFLRVSEA
ncbi:MAG TPA: 7TM domain-containing protein [Gemmataceae bacterium]|nr:7TM domain-containing protein [Gemmataceae bacterium]